MNNLQKIILSPTELSHGTTNREPIVLSSRIRIARNLAKFKFPLYANAQEKRAICNTISQSIKLLNEQFDFNIFNTEDLNLIELATLVERRLCSKEFAKIENNAMLVFSKDQTTSIMVNEEDHIRIQGFSNGLHLEVIWENINLLDDKLSAQIELAFSSKHGYLTSCPTNVGTGLRASAMLHLPGLTITKKIKEVIETSQKLGLVVRGLFGEGSNSDGEIFQISNQQTLGLSENDIIFRFDQIVRTIIEQEKEARKLLLSERKNWIYDHIGRSFGLLKNCYMIDHTEALTYLSLIRLAIDYDLLPEVWRTGIDRLMTEMQSGHLQLLEKKELTNDEICIKRGEIMRTFFAKSPNIKFE